jgi:hypothetical protein
MRTDPTPDETHLIFDCQRPVMKPYPYGPQLANLFEV